MCLKSASLLILQPRCSFSTLPTLSLTAVQVEALKAGAETVSKSLSVLEVKELMTNVYFEMQAGRLGRAD